jgi:hypothetical protein
MIEVLPYLHYLYYEEEKSDKFLKRNRIKCIIHLTSKNREFSSSEFEEVTISLHKNIQHDGEDAVNVELYSYLYDIIEFIYQKVSHHQHVCIMGYKNKQDIDALCMAYFIRFANVNYHEAHHYVLSKKLEHYYEKSYYYGALKKYAQQLELIKKIDY